MILGLFRNQLIRYSKKTMTSAVAKMTEITSVPDFRSILQSNDYVLVDFSATWCGPCRMLSPILERLAQSFPLVKFVKVDIDKFPQLSTEYRVSSVPFVVLLRQGNMVDSFVGARDDAFIKQFIDKNKK